MILSDLKMLWIFAGLLLITTLFFVGCSSPPEYDLVIKNGKIIDGSGNPSFIGDVAINADTIAAVQKTDSVR